MICEVMEHPVHLQSNSPSVLDVLDEFPKGGQLFGPPALFPHQQRSPKVVPPREELPAEALHGRCSVPVDYLPPVELFFARYNRLLKNVSNEIKMTNKPLNLILLS